MISALGLVARRASPSGLPSVSGSASSPAAAALRGRRWRRRALVLARAGGDRFGLAALRSRPRPSAWSRLAARARGRRPSSSTASAGSSTAKWRRARAHGRRHARAHRSDRRSSATGSGARRRHACSSPRRCAGRAALARRSRARAGASCIGRAGSSIPARPMPRAAPPPTASPPSPASTRRRCRGWRLPARWSVARRDRRLARAHVGRGARAARRRRARAGRVAGAGRSRRRRRARSTTPSARRASRTCCR